MSSRDTEKRGVMVEGKGKKKKLSVPAKAAIIVAGVLISLVCICVIVFLVLKASGYKSLYEKMAGKKPDMKFSDNTEIGWKEDWVRYDGKIYEYNQEILTFLVMGTDNENEITGQEGIGGQSDTNILVVMNPNEKIVKLFCINRDTMADVDVYGSDGEYFYTEKMQLALQHAYGSSRTENAQHMVTSVSRFLYNLQIHGYCSVNMSAISQINDAVGGVTVECTEDLTVIDRRFKKGSTVTLNGSQAFEYVRYRDEEVFESSRDRLERQKGYLEAFMEQVKSVLAANPAVAVNLYNSLSKEMVTDITVDEVMYLASVLPEYSFELEDIITLEGDTVMGEMYEEFYPDEQELKKTMIELFYREVVQ